MFEFFSSVFRRSSLLPLVVLGLLAPRLMAQADLQGQWSVASYQMPINPVHAALLKNGKVFVVEPTMKIRPRRSRRKYLWLASLTLLFSWPAVAAAWAEALRRSRRIQMRLRREPTLAVTAHFRIYCGYNLAARWLCAKDAPGSQVSVDPRLRALAA
jgi:hypothetical protein